ncbi:MAG TPA: AzlD domain-containing protein [Acidimicrobiales bacterium]|nr:AzlD domain-containing protein [Acidimicrobiales bacterium]
MSWVSVLVASVGCLVLKAVGYFVPAHSLEHPTVQRIAGLLPVTLLAALGTQQTVTHGRHLVLDARIPAVLVAAVAIRLRAPFLLVVAAAATTAALWRVAAG